MTTISLHRAPQSSTVLRTQLLATGKALKVGGLRFVLSIAVLCTLVTALGIRGIKLQHPMGVELMVLFFLAWGSTPELLVPAIMLIALVLPFHLWRDEQPQRRAYHLSMPAPQQWHTLAKVFAGWVWLMLAITIFVVLIVATLVVVKRLSHGPPFLDEEVMWQWGTAFTATTIAYFLGSAAVLASRHPGRWILGAFLAYLILVLAVRAVDWEPATEAIAALWSGYVGIAPALLGAISIDHMTHVAGATGERAWVLHSVPSAVRWLAAAALWGALAVGLTIWASRRRPA